ncbi:MAG TPA: TIR domain-containing protein [Thermoanaerobaculia bacterium]|jgi:hypothetical protein|nr:TIR domain-containing protein [Thermoanaerobaculia bacterium]
MKRLKVFVASPSDVAEERDIVTIVVEELRRIVGSIRDVELEAVRWETHAWPDVDDDAQALINRMIGEYDVFVGFMWRRFGTPTRRAESGTGEEFERAYDSFRRFGRPKIMFYFRTAPFYTTDLGDLEQFTRVVEFRKKLEDAGVLFWQYVEPLDFERFVREHLLRQILDITAPKARVRKHVAASTPRVESPHALQIFLSAARDDVEQVLPVYHALAAAGFRPWLDVQNLLPGQLWTKAIEQAIDESDLVLVFLSHSSVGREGFVQKELRMALQRMERRAVGDTFVIPVRLEDVEPPESLRNLQWVDLFGVGGLEYLMQAVRMVAERPTAAVRKRRLRVAK